VRVLVFHGYLLGGTGSNVYNARLAEALVRLGHEVHLLCQERHPEEHDFIDAAADWDAGALAVRELRGRPESGVAGAGRCTVYRPDIGGLLPVYVADRYEGIEARTFADCTDAEVARYVEANVAAVREVAARARPHVALANHLVMGPVVLARGLAGETPYAVKVHGSALEYTVKPQPERFLGLACEGVGGAQGVLVGSRHTAESLWGALALDGLEQRTRLGPPGVDVRRFAPRGAESAAAGVRALARRLVQAPAAQPDQPESAFARDAAAAGRALAALDPDDDALVAFVGKLIVSKGVDLLVAAWPLVLARVPHARLVVVGFGAYRGALEELVQALASGDLASARDLARAGRAAEGQGAAPAPLAHLLAFLDRLDGAERDDYVVAAASMGDRVVLTGRLEHEELAELLPACDALVVPSTFPEAFGMVAVEAAACGVLPVSAAHSGLAEVSDALAGEVPPAVAPLLAFPVDDRAVRTIAERVIRWLTLDPPTRAQARERLVAAVRERWSWEGVARGVIAAASGELAGLSSP
jgi:glycosyltransferase involved in cell wall biosynthesis